MWGMSTLGGILSDINLYALFVYMYFRITIT